MKEHQWFSNEIRVDGTGYQLAVLRKYQWSSLQLYFFDTNRYNTQLISIRTKLPILGIIH